jgi:hypothetical protein
VAGEASIDVRPDAVRAVASDIFLRCFPLALTDAARRAQGEGPPEFRLAPRGAMRPGGLQDDDRRIVVTTAWIDLSQEPVVLCLPHTRGRHYSLTLIDASGETFASFGSRTGEDAGADVALVGPRWVGELPGGIRARRAPSDEVWAVSRIHAHSMIDRPEALAIAARQRLAPLHCGRDRLALIAPFPNEPLPCGECQIEELGPTEFFGSLPGLLDRAPLVEQRALRLALTALRDRIGGPPDPRAWSPDFTRALALGFDDALSAIKAATQSTEAGAGAGGAAEPLFRAARVLRELGAPCREELLELDCREDEAGQALTGQQRYRLHFAAGALPPAHGFWWLSVRPAPEGVHRRGLGDRSEIAPNPDGSLDLIVQAEPPELDQMDNWLPAPDSQFSLVLRLHCPRTAALTGAWRMPAPKRIGPSSAGRSGRRRSPSKTFPGRPPNDGPPLLAWEITS